MLRYEPLALDWNAGFEFQAIHGVHKPKAALGNQRYALSVLFSIGVLLLSDILALLAACSLGYCIWAHAVLHMPLQLYRDLGYLLFVFPAAYASSGLYPGFGLGAVETIRRVTYCTCFGFLTLAAASFALKEGDIYSRLTFLISWLLALVSVPLFRFVALSAVSSLRWWGYKTVVIGTRDEAGLTIRTLRNAFSLGYRVVGVLSLTPDKADAAQEVDGIPVLGGLDVAKRLSERGVRAALVWDNSESATLVANLQHYFPRVILVRDERALPIEHLRIRNLGGVLGIEFTSHLFRAKNQLVKRTIDAVLGAVFAAVALPVILVSGGLIKLVSPGPIFYSQEREGLNGVKFKVLKLRTMYVDAEQRLSATLAENPDLARQWKETMKLNPDPRIVPVVGHFLRRFSIDESPQLFAVISGHMSLVGPRPFPEYHLKLFEARFRTLRTSVRPGLTGMWQVMIRSAGDVKAQELYDTFYIRNWSLWLDIYILARTIFAVVAGSGAC
ncbi:MAG TPA: exopolysaccharide biosynthesis polyprenyl glycosylphosphotransferase [Pyrinomonadaceae bacterium]|nr:exopolysaccharide biosynthesis polyprenyl glycosylphosphotransferase [Pyrinomonadaceae bacterium]